MNGGVARKRIVRSPVTCGFTPFESGRMRTSRIGASPPTTSTSTSPSAAKNAAKYGWAFSPFRQCVGAGSVITSTGVPFTFTASGAHVRTSTAGHVTTSPAAKRELHRITEKAERCMLMNSLERR